MDTLLQSHIMHKKEVGEWSGLAKTKQMEKIKHAQYVVPQIRSPNGLMENVLHAVKCLWNIVQIVEQLLSGQLLVTGGVQSVCKTTLRE